MKIEVGKSYEDGEGQIIKILYDDGGDELPFLGVVISGENKNGTYWYERDGEASTEESGDLIREAPREWVLRGGSTHDMAAVEGPALDRDQLIRVREVPDADS